MSDSGRIPYETAAARRVANAKVLKRVDGPPHAQADPVGHLGQIDHVVGQEDAHWAFRERGPKPRAAGFIEKMRARVGEVTAQSYAFGEQWLRSVVPEGDLSIPPANWSLLFMP